MDADLIFFVIVIGVVGIYLLSRIKIMGKENYMIVYRKGKIIPEGLSAAK